MNLEDQDAATITEAGAPRGLADGILWHVAATVDQVSTAILESKVMVQASSREGELWPTPSEDRLSDRQGVAALSLLDYRERDYGYLFSLPPKGEGTLIAWAFVLEGNEANGFVKNTPERSSLAAQAIAQIQGVLKQKDWTITVQS